MIFIWRSFQNLHIFPYALHKGLSLWGEIAKSNKLAQNIKKKKIHMQAYLSSPITVHQMPVAGCTLCVATERLSWALGTLPHYWTYIREMCLRSTFFLNKISRSYNQMSYIKSLISWLEWEFAPGFEFLLSLMTQLIGKSIKGKFFLISMSSL